MKSFVGIIKSENHHVLKMSGLLSIPYFILDEKSEVMLDDIQYFLVKEGTIILVFEETKKVSLYKREKKLIKVLYNSSIFWFMEGSFSYVA
jgi:hypothetical protein